MFGLTRWTNAKCALNILWVVSVAVLVGGCSSVNQSKSVPSLAPSPEASNVSQTIVWLGPLEHPFTVSCMGNSGVMAGDKYEALREKYFVGCVTPQFQGQNLRPADSERISGAMSMCPDNKVQAGEAITFNLRGIICVSLIQSDSTPVLIPDTSHIPPTGDIDRTYVCPEGEYIRGRRVVGGRVAYICGRPEYGPPPAPTEFRKTGSTATSISFAWQALTQPSVRYEIYKMNTMIPSGTKIGDITGLVFTTSKSSREWIYYVKAVSPAGVVSQRSNVVVD
ncbi:hypothetical protein ACX3YC_24375 [Pseudomonas mohnii]